MKKIFFTLTQIPRRVVLALIWVYQHTLSFDHGPLKVFFPYGYCRFSPSCSMYGAQAIERFGVIKGGALAAWRIARCNPWNPGGHDDVPPARSRTSSIS